MKQNPLNPSPSHHSESDVDGHSTPPDSVLMPFPVIPDPWNSVSDPACPAAEDDPDSYELEAPEAFEEGPIELADAVYSLNNTFKAEARLARIYNRFDPRYAAQICSLMKSAARIAQAVVTISKYQPERQSDPACSSERLQELYIEFSYHYRKTCAAARAAAQAGNQLKLDEMFTQQTALLYLLTRLFATRRMLLEKRNLNPASADETVLKASQAERTRADVLNKQITAAPVSAQVREPALSSFKSIPGYPGLKPAEMRFFEKYRQLIIKGIQPDASASLVNSASACVFGSAECQPVGSENLSQKVSSALEKNSVTETHTVQKQNLKSELSQEKESSDRCQNGKETRPPVCRENLSLSSPVGMPAEPLKIPPDRNQLIKGASPQADLAEINLEKLKPELHFPRFSDHHLI